jgi:enoyl-[acyl-carrier protein] reductase I
MQGLMQGKRGLIMGVANDHSIAWGIAQALAKHGAEIAFTFQGEALERRVRPLAESIGSNTVLPCDVEDIASVDKVFADLKKQWGTLDFYVHAIGFSDKNELKGRFADTSRDNFVRTMVISAFSFAEGAKRAGGKQSIDVGGVHGSLRDGQEGRFGRDTVAANHASGNLQTPDRKRC